MQFEILDRRSFQRDFAVVDQLFEELPLLFWRLVLEPVPVAIGLRASARGRILQPPTHWLKVVLVVRDAPQVRPELSLVVVGEGAISRRPKRCP